MLLLRKVNSFGNSVICVLLKSHLVPPEVSIKFMRPVELFKNIYNTIHTIKTATIMNEVL